MKTLLLAACVFLPAGPLHAAQGVDKTSGKTEAKSTKTAAKAAENASTSQTKPEATQEDKKPERRTFKDLIDFALAQGVDRPMKSPSAENLGLTPGAAAKAFRYKSTIAPDGQEHGFYVLYRPAKKGSAEPYGQVWRLTRIHSNAGSRQTDAWSLRLSLEGTLEAAFKAEGDEGAVVQTKYPIDSPEVRKIYEQERRFFLEESLQLKPSLR
ncbi:MAG: hypothetical protein HZB91_13335 [Elusimicrobia bacterium]|nr:hypothetical protein [Elusimicrobiota bacterium]